MAAAAAAAAPVVMLDQMDSNMNMDVDKLTSEIFSILENKFLFGYDDPTTTKHSVMSAGNNTGKVRILSIDAGGSTDGVLAAKSLAHLESTLRFKSANPNAHISDFFDVVAGAGAGGVLAALLFTKGTDGRPMFTADRALGFLLENGRKLSKSSPDGLIRRVFGRPSSSSKAFKKVFGELTLKDTVKAVLIPCYDLATGGPFLFSRADAVEMDGCDFKMADVCGATTATSPLGLKAVDGRTKIVAVGGGVAMSNPTAAAITHVLNNKHEFPFCNGVDDLLVVSLGNGEPDSSAANATTGNVMSSPAAFVKIAGDGAADMVDQAVSMAFGNSRTTNYVRIQGNIGIYGKEASKGNNKRCVGIAEEMLKQKNVESVLFEGKKLGESTNIDKIKVFAGELIKEQERRKTSILPPVILKQASPSSPARTSSATTLSSASSY